MVPLLANGIQPKFQPGFAPEYPRLLHPGIEARHAARRWYTVSSARAYSRATPFRKSLSTIFVDSLITLAHYSTGAAFGERTAVIIVEVADGVFGVIVDSVSDVAAIPQSRIQPG